MKTILVCFPDISGQGENLHLEREREREREKEREGGRELIQNTEVGQSNKSISARMSTPDVGH